MTSDNNDTEEIVSKDKVMQVMRLCQKVTEAIESEFNRGNDPTFNVLLSVLTNMNARIFSSISPEVSEEEIFKKLERFYLNLGKAISVLIKMNGNKISGSKKIDDKNPEKDQLRCFTDTYKNILGSEVQFRVNNMSGVGLISIIEERNDDPQSTAMIIPIDVARKLALFILNEIRELGKEDE
jgi:hypothetical protein